jgi:hypothetical protein
MRGQQLVSSFVVWGLLSSGLMIWAQAPTSPEGAAEAAVTRRYSNVKWSAERNTLVGANIVVTRQGDQIRGTYTLFNGNEQGTPYRFTGTVQDGHVSFTVRTREMTLRFTGRMTEQELVGRMTITRPDGTREEREFKARRLWR